ncbi:MAG: PAS domain S-box protein [Elusimicrobiota bacterium]
MADKNKLAGGFILIVEDDRGASSLEARRLAPLGLEIRCAYSAKEAIDVLKSGLPGLMLLDYSLPGMSALELLAELEKSSIQMPPFIVITGQGDEKMAVEVMKSGAEDYLVKDSVLLDNLLDRVKRALATAELKRRLRSSEANFRAFFDTMDDIILVGGLDGRIIYSNPATTRKLGYRAAELEKMTLLELHPAGLRREAEAIVGAMFKGERDSCPLPVQSKAGGLVPVETRAWFGKWDGEDCIFGISKDLTREQEVLQKFNRLFNSNPAPMAVSSMPEHRFTEVNEAFLKLLGYAREEVIGRTAAELNLFIQPEKQREIGEHLREHGRVSNCELKVRCRNGVVLDGLFSGESVVSQGLSYFLTVMTDVTEHKLAEEKLLRQAEELLARNRELTRFNQAAIGRELRMIELKREVNELCGKLGEPPRHRIAGDGAPPEPGPGPGGLL